MRVVQNLVANGVCNGVNETFVGSRPIAVKLWSASSESGARKPLLGLVFRETRIHAVDVRIPAHNALKTKPSKGFPRDRVP